MDLLRRLPVENILLDIALLLVAFALPDATAVIGENLVAAFWLTAPLQVLALFCAFWHRDDGDGRVLPDWLSGLQVLNSILAVGSFVWLYLVALAVEQRTGAFPYWGFRFAFGAALIGGILAYFLGRQASEEFETPLAARYLLIVPIFVYLCFTESLIEVSIGIAHPSKIAIAATAIISYLPVRLALAFQPPFSYFDLASALVCFAAYLISVM